MTLHEFLTQEQYAVHEFETMKLSIQQVTRDGVEYNDSQQGYFRHFFIEVSLPIDSSVKLYANQTLERLSQKATRYRVSGYAGGVSFDTDWIEA